MSWFKHEDDAPVDLGQKREISQGTNFFTDPQSYNENSRSLKARSVMKNDMKNEYLMQQQLAEKKREEKLESKRFNADKAYEQQVNERRGFDEKQDEKLRKLEKQRFYQMQLQQQMQDNFDRKQVQRARENQDNQKIRSPFNSGVPLHQRDITNQEQLDALEIEKKSRREKQDQYARQLSAQLDEQYEKKMLEKYQRRQPNPGAPEGDSLERLQREKDQRKREYADSLQEHIDQQSQIKQQQKEKEPQYLTGLDIKGSYKFNGPTKQQLREDLANQIKEKEFAKMNEHARQNDYQRQNDYSRQNEYDRNPYEQNQQADYGYAPQYGEQIPQQNEYYLGKASGAKENAVALDIFGNPTRQHQKLASKGGDFDIFGNPVKRR